MSPAQRYSTISQSINHETTARDDELLLAAKAGSHSAFAELQHRYSHRLYKRILLITRNREDAEDALQDTFIRAFRSLPSFEGRAKFSSWLTRIAINSGLMLIRRRRSRPETSLEQQSEVGCDSPCFDVRDSAMSPEQLCEQEERYRSIMRAVERLDPKLRAPICIWISQERSMEEMARDLGISVASVKARLHRARKRLIRSPALRNHRAEFVPTAREASNLRLKIEKSHA